MSIGSDRTFAQRSVRPTALTSREQLALTLLADEWSNAALRMCFEVDKPEKYVTQLSEGTVREIARYEAARVREDGR